MSFKRSNPVPVNAIPKELADYLLSLSETIPVDVADYGGGFANYVPPAGTEGEMRVAIDTNTTTPGKRLYIYANSEWNYVDLT